MTIVSRYQSIRQPAPIKGPNGCPAEDAVVNRPKCASLSLPPYRADEGLDGNYHWQLRSP